jgi:hypothetical protein
MIVAVSTRCAPMLYFKAFLCSVFSVAPWRMGLGIGSTPYTGIGILFCDGCLVSAAAFGGTAMDWSIDIGKMNEEFDRVKTNCCIEAQSRSKGNPPNDNCCTYQCNE